ncbi:MAG: hypothetical protein ACI9YH_002672 [Colwellia sp.]
MVPNIEQSILLNQANHVKLSQINSFSLKQFIPIGVRNE